MFGLGMPELIIILLVFMLLFGANRLPEIGKALGKTIQEFKKASKEVLGDHQENHQADKKP